MGIRPSLPTFRILSYNPGDSDPIQGFEESLQHDSSNQSEIIVMIKLYCYGPGYAIVLAIYPLLYK